MSVGGTTGSSDYLATTEEYNGTAWTGGGTLNLGRSDMGGAGIQTAALVFGGYTGSNTGATELYDGTSWTTSSASLATPRRVLGGCGTQASALAFGGFSSGDSNATEEFTGAFNAAQTLTTST